MDTSDDQEFEKLSNAKSLGFRPGTRLRGDIAEFLRELKKSGRKVGLSEFLRETLKHFWPQIRTWWMSDTLGVELTSEETSRVLGAIKAAQTYGLTVTELECLITEAVNQKAAKSA